MPEGKRKTVNVEFHGKRLQGEGEQRAKVRNHRLTAFKIPINTIAITPKVRRVMISSGRYGNNAPRKSKKPPNRAGSSSKMASMPSTMPLSLSVIISTRDVSASRILPRMAPASSRIPPIPEPIRSPSCSQRLLSLIDGVALLEQVSIVVIGGLHGTLYHPGVARCGEGVGLGFAAQRAGGDGLASRDAGRFRFVGFLPVMGAGIRAGSPGTARNHVIDVVSIAALDNGNVLVSVGDSDCVAGFGSHRIAAVLVVVGPIGDSGAFTSGGIEKLVSGFVDNAGIVGYLGNLAVIADYAVVADNAGGAGGDATHATHIIIYII